LKRIFFSEEDIACLKYRIEFLRKNWKLCIHLLFRTKRFGVNNEWWSLFPSFYFGDPWWKIVINIIMIKPIVRNYKTAKLRAIKLGFLHPDTVKKLRWEYKEKKKK
jgi:hypothetical protein